MPTPSRENIDNNLRLIVLKIDVVDNTIEI